MDIKKKKISESPIKAKIKKSEEKTSNLASIAKKATIAASKRAMTNMGYVIKVEKGWIIKENQDGTKNKIRELEAIPSKLIFKK